MLLPKRVLQCRKCYWLRNIRILFIFSLSSTITEEAESPAANHKTATNSISITRTIVHSVKTTDANNGASQINNNQNSIQASLSSTNSNLTVPATPTTTKVQTKSNQSSQRTVLKSKRILSSRTEIKDNIVNKAHEDLLGAKHSTPKQNVSTSSSRVSPNILENLNLNDHLAYKEYKEAGEYWK